MTSQRTELHKSVTPDGLFTVALVRGTAGEEPAGSGTRTTPAFVYVRVTGRDGVPGGQRYSDTEEGREKALARYGELTGMYFPVGMSPLHR